MRFRIGRREIVRLVVERQIRRAVRRMPPRPGRAGEPTPAEPPKPSFLSGGAAATLEFDD